MTEPIDLAQINKAMTIPAFGFLTRQRWLENSWSDPQNFWLSVLERSSLTHHLRSKSAPFGYYDFAYDILHRVDNPQTPALRFVSNRQEIVWTYGELREAVAATANCWLSMGVQPGVNIALLIPFDIPYVVSLLAALSLGATVCPVLPKGSRLVNERLTNLAPEFVATDELYGRLLGNLEFPVLPPQAPITDNKPLPTFAYPSGAPVLRLYDPCQRRGGLPVAVSADILYLSSLRDGMVLLGLRPGDQMAAPAAHYMEHQPSMFLSCLLNGATWLEGQGQSAAWWLEQTLRAIFLDSTLRDEILSSTQPEVIKWDLWLRNLAESNYLEQWQAFARFGPLAEIPGVSFKWNSTHGGALLWSLRRHGAVTSSALPAPGVPWILTNPADGLTEAIYGFGLFTPLWLEEMPAEGSASACLLADGQVEWAFAGIHGLSRQGRYYPQEHLQGILDEELGTEKCAIGVVPRPNSFDSRFDVIILTGDRTIGDEATVIGQVNQLAEQQLGAEHLPDKVVIVPLSIRRGEEGGIDHKWLTSRYPSGLINHMVRDGAFRALSDLRCLFRRAKETLELEAEDSVK